MTELPETISTVANSARVKIPVGLCRFFASVAEVTDETAARQFIADVTSEFADANHSAWAYKLGWGDRAICRQSDDGEPANTAGAPMLQVIEGAGLSNVVVIASRYFGGVKLGVGGLIRAYRDCAQAGLQAAGVRTELIQQEVLVRELDYAILGEVLREIESIHGSILAIDYQLRVTVRALIQPKFRVALSSRITDITRGQGQLEGC